MNKTNFTSKEWLDLWNGFWEKEKGNYIKQKRVVMSQTWDLEDDMCEGEEKGLFDEGDGLNDKEEADGWVMEV